MPLQVPLVLMKIWRDLLLSGHIIRKLSVLILSMVIEVPQTRVATYYLVSLLTPKFDLHNLTFTLSAVLGCRELIG